MLKSSFNCATPNIDWHNLPLTARLRKEPNLASTSAPTPTLRIKNIVKQQKNIQQQIGQLKPNHTDSQLESIGLSLTECVREIDRKLGHYEPLRDRIVMSRTLDSSHVPQMVVELVLYHELLHKHHGAKLLNGKRMVHTPEFRRSERQFRHYQEAQQWLERSFPYFLNEYRKGDKSKA